MSKKFEYFHNPRCSKSRQGLELLKENGIEPTIVEYLKEGWNKSKLKEIFQKLGKKPKDVIRTKEQAFKDLGSQVEQYKEDEWLRLIEENPVLMERPILLTDKHAAIGRPPEDLLKIL